MTSRGGLASILFLAGSVALGGCSSGPVTPSPTAPTPTAALITTGPNSATVGPQPSTAGAPGLTIIYEENAQVELIAASGRRVLVDVAASSRLSKPAGTEDILLTSHAHSDHYDPNFVDTFPGQKITIEQADIRLDDVTISSIPAAHDDGGVMAPKDGSDYVFVIDMAGLRVVHFGDLGQTELSADQLAKIGKVDVAISQLYNTYSSMDATNQKGFNQMKQVGPRILIPTHLSPGTAELAVSTWSATYATAPLSLTGARLPARTTVVFMGGMAASYGQEYKLTSSPW
jgi:hypothetical protein